MSDEIMTAEELGEFLGHVSEGTLGNWRYKGHGPRFYKAGRRVLYRKADVLAWLEQNARDPEQRAARASR